jgi:hypothetical protein
VRKRRACAMKKKTEPMMHVKKVQNVLLNVQIPKNPEQNPQISGVDLDANINNVDLIYSKHWTYWLDWWVSRK